MRVFGSEDTSTGVLVVALPVKSVLTIGLPGGVVSVAFSVEKVNCLDVPHYQSL